MKDRNTNRPEDRGEGGPRPAGWRHLRRRLGVRRVHGAVASSLVIVGAAAALIGLPGAAGAAPHGAMVRGLTGVTTTTTTTTGTGSTTTTTSTGTTTSTVASTTSTATSTTTTKTSTTSSVPAGFTTCKGHVTPKPKAVSGEPNLLDFTFSCNGSVTSFTVTVDRSGEKGGTVENFNPNATVTQSAAEGFNCGGTIPSNGFNCNPLSETKPSPMTAGYDATGSFDPVETYCKHLPAKGKAGTPAIPAAVVSVVVTEPTGYEDGPFVLTDTKSCPKVANVVPKKKTKKKKSKKGDERS